MKIVPLRIRVSLLIILLISLLSGISGCQQDSIFDYISNEVIPTKPFIRGTPSKMVVKGSNKDLYIANGNAIYRYAGSRWLWYSNPGKFVTDLAVTKEGTDDTLYALSFTGSGTNTKVYGVGWVEVGNPTEYPFIQSIFGAGDILFAGAAPSTNNGSYAILYKKPNENSFTPLPTGSEPGLLTGAGVFGTGASAVYYLSTTKSGIMQIEDNGSGSFIPVTASTISGDPIPSNISGLIQTGDLIIASSVDGSNSGRIISLSYDPGIPTDIPPVLPTVDSHVSATFNYTFTGGLAVMESNFLLLIGVKNGNGSYNHGYREMGITLTTGVVDNSLRDPGKFSPSSIQANGNDDSYAKYNASLGRNPVNFLQVSSDGVIFASTQRNGLFSYRNRSSGGWQWNAEEEYP
ncbi:putative lipoprotein [Treponema primitia ZAS-2]|uniref:Putative lipoprotein n=1 Tax=Treponema primitia (strain ATCC BAA-887 / DSM 12427 / ZAS-2) TaxID=545694 RepID=F5YHF9_TREPZ|nr:hypothetical protein [Treponema primitia]AEF84023.1 putative lipoprotein [Treponema primitia ZAS-2]